MGVSADARSRERGLTKAPRETLAQTSALIDAQAVLPVGVADEAEA